MALSRWDRAILPALDSCLWHESWARQDEMGPVPVPFHLGGIGTRARKRALMPIRNPALNKGKWSSASCKPV